MEIWWHFLNSPFKEIQSFGSLYNYSLQQQQFVMVVISTYVNIGTLWSYSFTLHSGSYRSDSAPYWLKTVITIGCVFYMNVQSTCCYALELIKLDNLTTDNYEK